MKDTSSPSTFSQKWALVAFLEPISDGKEFSMREWPLHCTLAGTVAVDWSSELLTQLEQSILQQLPLAITVATDSVFGAPTSPVPINLVKNSVELTRLHTTIAQVLLDAGAVFNEPDYILSGFVPHITRQSHSQVHEGDSYVLTTLSIIDMFPGGDPIMRKVWKTFKIPV